MITHLTVEIDHKWVRFSFYMWTFIFIINSIIANAVTIKKHPWIGLFRQSGKFFIYRFHFPINKSHVEQLLPSAYSVNNILLSD